MVQKKRLLSIVLCVVLVFLLCACGTKSAVKKELIGIYIGSNDLFTRGIKFNEDGTYVEIYKDFVGSERTVGGTWEMQGDHVILIHDGDTEKITYEYNKNTGELVLYYNQSSEPYAKYED